MTLGLYYKQSFVIHSFHIFSLALTLHNEWLISAVTVSKLMRKTLHCKRNPYIIQPNATRCF